MHIKIGMCVGERAGKVLKTKGKPQKISEKE